MVRTLNLRGNLYRSSGREGGLLLFLISSKGTLREMRQRNVYPFVAASLYDKTIGDGYRSKTIIGPRITQDKGKIIGDY